MAKKKDERLVKQAYKEERKAVKAQKKADGETNEPYLQPNDDHFVSFKNQLATMGLMLRDIPGDGNCLFRALNDQLEGHGRNHLRLRHDTVRFMMEHRQDFEPFVEDDVPFQTHVRQLSQPGTYGGHDALVAFARSHKVNIVIHQLNSPLWQIEGGPLGCSQAHLSYHNGEHYSSVRRAGDTSESAANVRINVTANGGADTSSNNVNKKGRESRFSHREHAVGGGVFNDDDHLAQRIASRTGCKDLSMITEALADHGGDEQGATDFVISLMLATDSGFDAVEGFDDAEVGTSGSISTRTVDSSKPKRVDKAKATKKLTNKQRKEQNRREKQSTRPRNGNEEPRKSAVENENGPADEALVVEAAFGCLRI